MSPYADPPYDLPSCRLEALRTADEAQTIAATLAGLSPWRELGYTASGLQGYLLRTDAALHRFSITTPAGTAGVLCVRDPWLRGPYIELVCLFPGWQGQGIGAELIAFLAGDAGLAESTASLPRNLWALVSTANAVARRFYARSGFVEIAPLADLVRAGCDEILLRKPLR